MPHDFYDNPLIGRYASREMSELWGPRKKFRTWRQLWIALAEAEAELGLPISPEQIAELKAQCDNLDLENAARHEKILRHDVMAHVHAYGDVCPLARPIIHLGATSCYVTDNADLLLMRESLQRLAVRLAAVIDHLGTFAERQRNLACLGFTHLQPAQPTTVGKRACLWAYDFALDLYEVEHRLAELKGRGVKGTTGTQASFLALFHGDHDQVRKLEQRVSEKMGFASAYPVTGQTYSRKIDSQIMGVLSGIAQSAHKFGTDLRLLQSRKEVEEPFEEEQIGSSAMAYKRNPMRAERMCGLARFVCSLESSAAATAATQWLERTLDDSANRRLTLPQAFLACDAILSLAQNVSSGLRVYPHGIAKHLQEELPFMATENLLMAAVERGGDRQELHEVIRHNALAAGDRVKSGESNNLLESLSQHPAFAGLDFTSVLDPSKFVGRAPEQVLEFLSEIVAPIRARYAAPAPTADVRV